MATIALFAVGSYFGGPLGGAAGAALGGWIDRQYTYPMIFGGPEPLEGPKLDDLDLQTATEGAPLKYAMGPECPLAGNLIWLSPRRSIRVETETGGKGSSGPPIISYEYYRDVAIALCEGKDARYDTPEANKLLKIWADSKVIYEDGAPADSRLESVTFYPGSLTQTPDPTIEAYEGAGEVPGYRGTVYVVIKNLWLRDFGQRLPNFRFLLQKDNGKSVQSCIVDLLVRAGAPLNSYTADRVPGCIRGYVFSGPQPTAAVLEPIMLAHNLNVQESSGRLSFFKRGEEQVIDVAARDLATREFDTAPVARPMLFTDPPDRRLPRMVSVKYIDPALNYEQGGQAATRQNSRLEGTQTFDIPMVLTADEARAISERLVWSTAAEKKGVATSLPASYIHAEEGDLFNLPDGATTHSVRGTQLDTGANFVISLQGTIAQSQTNEQTGPADGPTRNGDSNSQVYVPPVCTMQLLDVPPLRDSEAEAVGVYWGVCALSPSAVWKGANVFDSTDNATYLSAFNAPFEAAIGVTSSALGAPPAPGIWDRASSVIVELYDGSLSSHTEEEVLRGVNRIWIGSEIIGFQLATLISTRKYRLSLLLRGLRDTHDAALTHVVGERCIVLDANTMGWKAYNTTQLSSRRYFKPVPTGGAVGDAAPQSLILQGATLRHFSPTRVEGARDGSNNLTLTWLRRTRTMYRLFSVPRAPLLDTSEDYEVDILDAPGGTVLRTISVSAATSISYSAADQTTDGLTPGDPIDVEVYQISSIVGRSKPAEATV